MSNGKKDNSALLINLADVLIFLLISEQGCLIRRIETTFSAWDLSFAPLKCQLRISLCSNLRLLTLWFDYGHWPGVTDIMTEGIQSIQIENWLQVIPQLIARIDTPRLLVQRLVHQLLVDIGKAHPQVNLLSLETGDYFELSINQEHFSSCIRTSTLIFSWNHVIYRNININILLESCHVSEHQH